MAYLILWLLLLSPIAAAETWKCLDYLETDKRFEDLITARTSHFARSTESYVSPLEEWTICMNLRHSGLAYADLITAKCWPKIPGWFRQMITDHEDAYITIYAGGRNLSGYDRSVLLKLAQVERERHCPQ